MELPSIQEIKTTIQVGWESLGKFLAAHSYHKEPLPPPPPDEERPLGPNY